MITRLRVNTYLDSGKVSEVGEWLRQIAGKRDHRQLQKCSSLNLIGQLASGDRSGSSVGWRSGGDHRLLCERDGVKEGLHRGLAEAPPTLMRPDRVVQQGLRTPTGPVSAKFSIDGIRGLAWPFMSMRRLRRRMAFISVAR